MKYPSLYKVYRNYFTKLQTNRKEEFDDNANIYATMLCNIWQNNIRNDHNALQSGSVKLFLIPLPNTTCKCRTGCEMFSGHATKTVFWIHTWKVLRTLLGNWRIKNQLDATCYFIVLLIGSTCFGHYYAHHQEFATMMLITTLVV